MLCSWPLLACLRKSTPHRHARCWYCQHEQCLYPSPRYTCAHCGCSEDEVYEHHMCWPGFDIEFAAGHCSPA